MTYSLFNDVRDVEAGGSNPLTPTSFFNEINNLATRLLSFVV
jgi:hypothetical protein